MTHHGDDNPRAVELVILAEARHEVGAADHKASMVLAVLGIGFGALLGGLIARDWTPQDLSGLGVASWTVGAALALGSVGAAGSAVWPRYTVPDAPGDLHYWGHIAAFPTPGAMAEALDAQPPRLSDRTRHQMFELSHIVARKYWWVRVAMRLAAAAAPCFVVASLAGQA